MMTQDADDAAKDQASDNALGQNHPLAAVCGVFKDNPVLDAVMEEVYANRRRKIAEVEAEIEAENEAASRGATTMAQEITLPVVERTPTAENGQAGTRHSHGSSIASDQDNPWLSIIGVFKDNPEFDAVMEEVYKNRRRMAAELEAEIAAENATVQ